MKNIQTDQKTNQGWRRCPKPKQKAKAQSDYRADMATTTYKNMGAVDNAKQGQPVPHKQRFLKQADIMKKERLAEQSKELQRKSAEMRIDRTHRLQRRRMSRKVKFADEAVQQVVEAKMIDKEVASSAGTNEAGNSVSNAREPSPLLRGVWVRKALKGSRPLWEQLKGELLVAFNGKQEHLETWLPTLEAIDASRAVERLLENERQLLENERLQLEERLLLENPLSGGRPL